MRVQLFFFTVCKITEGKWKFALLCLFPFFSSKGASLWNARNRPEWLAETHHLQALHQDQQADCVVLAGLQILLYSQTSRSCRAQLSGQWSEHWACLQSADRNCYCYPSCSQQPLYCSSVDGDDVKVWRLNISLNVYFNYYFSVCERNR